MTSSLRGISDRINERWIVVDYHRESVISLKYRRIEQLIKQSIEEQPRKPDYLF